MVESLPYEEIEQLQLFVQSEMSSEGSFVIDDPFYKLVIQAILTLGSRINVEKVDHDLPLKESHFLKSLQAYSGLSLGQLDSLCTILSSPDTLIEQKTLDQEILSSSSSLKSAHCLDRQSFDQRQGNLSNEYLVVRLLNYIKSRPVCGQTDIEIFK
ncbi:hypothetical protein FGO68_gene834 [Halteria grandinella]|uniref:Uncharacterized protein n=1 Tax=Halteria grandinella TaxID=5974 RepID=A0A8J8NKD1_HALGN|nr:hypothetical protein FGO68_gene834 [Halteria grandinella]